MEVKPYEFDVFGGSQEDGYGLRRKWLGRGEVEGARGLGWRPYMKKFEHQGI